ncbi:hypothetical protein FOA43_003947 [Brettanomyces nanus]|uniref:Pseudouridine synthase n=1 Tax=Eeniella nana TaxID=13502 RepID=A0A875RWW6_EENNA|nr:uncharacterized protein FOA43_003947 [Brettanomyces nanus]QPG76557.1 hypothetical protein FOA43_003947 [Brettanomyces nanus]
MPPVYHFQNGLRFVAPYYYTYRTTVKGRWFDRSILEVFTEEFRDYDRGHYIKRIEEDNVQVIRKRKGKETVYKGKILMDLPLESGDLVIHKEHKHERPVSDTKIKIVHNDQNILVVDKPSGIPMHPVQGYLYNTLTEILKKDLSLKRLHPCNRLDKLTSGVVLLCKNVQSASFYQQMIQNRNFTKEYVARVDGKFPTIPCECSDDVVVIDAKRKSHGFCRREALTRFKLLKYSPILNQSIVLCKPVTGRTHQIRIHLRNLGHAIVNDPLYNPKLNNLLGNAKKIDLTTREGQEVVQNEHTQKRIDLLSGQKCPECGIDLYKEPDSKSLIMYLHALRYSSKNEQGELQCYETEMPQWTYIT